MEGGREEGREGVWERGRKRGRVGGWKSGRVGGRKGEREGGREEGREGGREAPSYWSRLVAPPWIGWSIFCPVSMADTASLSLSLLPVCACLC